MIPNVDDRLASVVRALTEVILPHLPAEASLAQEQAHLAIGHLQILRAQIDAVPGFERGELDDAVALAAALGSGVSGGAATHAALAGLAAAARAADGGAVRGQYHAVCQAVEALVRAVASDGDAAGKAALSRIVLEHEAVRAQKDREWFAPFGFDTL
jgi:hypothetical protein